MSFTVRAPAKINLHLGVGARREDGYHPLRTVYQAIGLYDDVTVFRSDRWRVAVEPIGDVDVSEVPLDESNIAIEAGKLLAAHHGRVLVAGIEINKGIPVAGGMAGGSADAAAALVALDRLWDLGTSDDDMLAIAAELGSDVPFALLGGTALGTGRGELVEPVLDNGDWWWLAITSSEGLSTAAVYREYDNLGLGEVPEVPMALLSALADGDVDDLADALSNDLLAPALTLRPALAEILQAGLDAGALATLLSGSGPTCLCLCRDQGHALATKQSLLDDGFTAVLGAPGPVAGAHLVEYA
jgi:4-diphosphocytidyl-2-C-methyl-D-erythritol kinase